LSPLDGQGCRPGLNVLRLNRKNQTPHLRIVPVSRRLS
jgi:hypothetical protein